jgi:hypothetical protein
MRDKRFIAVHRGGPLTLAQHRELINWATLCAGQGLEFLDEATAQILANILTVAKAWENGQASVGDARNASLQAIALAKTLSEPTAIATTRAVGHAVATAHMADHALRAADYALKAFKLAGQPVDEALQWQNAQLPNSISELVISARTSQK